MSQQYSHSQPAGTKNRIEKVAIVGAGGNVGKHFADALLQTGKHTVTAITRADSKSSPPAGASVAIVDYDDQSSLVKAMEGHDVLIITLSVFAPAHTEKRLIDAASTAGVSWVMPNLYGMDPEQLEMQRDIRFQPRYEETLKYIGAKPGLSMLGLACSYWYEYSLCSTLAFGFDTGKREVIFYDDGNTKINTSTWPQCGLAVAKLLSLPILPENDRDKSLTLDRFRNKFVYISSFFVSQKDMFASLLRVTGTKETDWKINYEESKKRWEDGQKELVSGNFMGWKKLMYARVFFPDGCGNYEAKLHNGLLGLSEENMDACTRDGIVLARTGYGR